MEDGAAHNLVGIRLKSGWAVIEKFSKSANSTGSFFSVCYKVKKENQICFLKAFDFAKFLHTSEPKRSTMDIISDMSTAYKYERDLSIHCSSKHVTKVAFVIEAGEEVLNNYAIGYVPYLIFDLADGDVRSRLDFSNKLDFSWKLKSLHDIAVGLQQLHNINVSHQDLKPSNILVFHKESKLGDLGRSICKDIDGPYNNLCYTGDLNYTPPEIMYKYWDSDWNNRVFAIDCYLLGSMIVFYFAGISMSALLLKHIPDNFRWEIWKGGFNEIKPYLIDSFSKALSELRENFDDAYFKKEITLLVEQLCNPFPEKRGHPKNIAISGSNFGLERFITRLDVLKKRAELELR